MCQKEIFDTVLSIVCRETDLSTQQILSENHCNEYSDARTILTSILYVTIGMNSVQIAALSGFSASGVLYLMNRLDDRCRNSFLFQSTYRRTLECVRSEILSGA